MKNTSLNYRLITLSAFILASISGSAQNTGAAGSKSTSSILDLFFENLILILGTVVVVAAFGTIIYLFNMLLRLQERRMLLEKGIEVVDQAAVAKESWLRAMYRKITGTIPIEKEKEILFDHSYDGIRELDNSLPPWWVALFYITIIFSVVYVGYYHFSDYGPDQLEEYAQELQAAEAAKLAFLAKQANTIDETNVVAVNEEAFIAAGKDIFVKNCVPCHGALGEGTTIGPNLTDEYWLHGGGVKNIFKTVKYGVIQKGMQSWKELLPPVAIQQVSSYILILQGTNPPNAKAPEGELYKDDTVD